MALFISRKSSFSKYFSAILIVVLLVLSLAQNFVFPSNVRAAAATGYLRLDRVKANTATGGVVCVNPTTNETTVRKMDISFADGSGTGGAASFAVNATGSNWTWDTTGTNLPAGTSAFPGTATTSTVSGGTVTFVVTADQSLNTGTVYCLHFTGTSTLTTPTSAATNLTGTINLRDSSGTLLTGETVDYATSVVTNDQVVVTGTVPATFTLTIAGAPATFSTNIPTSSTPATTNNITVTVSTNANNGWTSWAKNTNANSALVSSSTSDGICFGGDYPTCTGAAYQTGSGNVHSLSGAAGYGMSAAAGTGTPTIATEYAGSSSSFGSLDSTKFEKVSSMAAPVSGAVTTLTFGAEATATNKAATDYTDTVTLTAAGSF